MNKEYYIVEIINKENGEIASVQVCVCKQEIEEIAVSDNYEKYFIPCDKETALKSLKSFRKRLTNN